MSQCIFPKSHNNIFTFSPPFQFFADEELFSGMYIDFMGTDAAIFRSLTKRNAVRTDQHNSKWLSGKMPLFYHGFSWVSSRFSFGPFEIKSLSFKKNSEFSV